VYNGGLTSPWGGKARVSKMRLGVSKTRLEQHVVHVVVLKDHDSTIMEFKTTT
jgi:hypothetical protein